MVRTRFLLHVSTGGGRQTWISAHSVNEECDLTPMRVKIREIRNLYVLNVYCAWSRSTIAAHRVSRREPVPANVVAMPVGDDSVVTQFLRYHVLVRRFGGDPDAWLAQLDAEGGDGGDVRFVRWIRSRLRQDPALMTSIRTMVDATPFWRAA